MSHLPSLDLHLRRKVLSFFGLMVWLGQSQPMKLVCICWYIIYRLKSCRPCRGSLHRPDHQRRGVGQASRTAHALHQTCRAASVMSQRGRTAASPCHPPAPCGSCRLNQPKSAAYWPLVEFRFHCPVPLVESNVKAHAWQLRLHSSLARLAIAP